jgi:Protein of unknown function (DUF3800)
MPLAAYFDESSDGRADTLFVLAGWIAPLDIWQIFDERWREIIGRYGITEYHAHDCTQRSKAFKGWTDERVAGLQRELLSALEEAEPTGIGVSLNIRDYNKLPQSKTLPPYHACWQYCLIEAARTVAGENEVSFILDRRDKTFDKADKIKELMRECPAWESGNKIGTVALQDSHKFPPLQAADWLAYEILRHAAEKNTTEEGWKLRSSFLVTYQEFFEDNIRTLLDELKLAGFLNRAS